MKNYTSETADINHLALWALGSEIDNERPLTIEPATRRAFARVSTSTIVDVVKGLHDGLTRAHARNSDHTTAAHRYAHLVRLILAIRQ